MRRHLVVGVVLVVAGAAALLARDPEAVPTTAAATLPEAPRAAPPPVTRAVPSPAAPVATVTITGDDDPGALRPWRPPQAGGGPESYSIGLRGDVAAGNLTLSGGLRADQLCFWRPAAADAPESVVRRIAARRGVSRAEFRTIDHLIRAPEYEWSRATWAPGGPAERLYGVRVPWPGVSDLLRPGPAAPQPRLTCGRSVTPDAAFWAAVEAEWPAARSAPALFLRPGLLAAVAYQRVRINRSPPTISHSPARAAVVRLPTWFWTDPAAYRTVEVTAELEGNDATVRAEPRLVVSFTGPESGTVQCAGTGTPYAAGDESTCTHTFRRPGRYRLSARVVYDVRWLRGGVPQEDLRAETTPPAVTVLPVREVQVLTR